MRKAPARVTCLRVNSAPNAMPRTPESRGGVVARQRRRSRVWKCPRRESNPDLRFRKPLFYPLNYGDACVTATFNAQRASFNSEGGLLPAPASRAHRASQPRAAQCTTRRSSQALRTSAPYSASGSPRRRSALQGRKSLPGSSLHVVNLDQSESRAAILSSENRGERARR